MRAFPAVRLSFWSQVLLLRGCNRSRGVHRSTIGVDPGRATEDRLLRDLAVAVGAGLLLCCLNIGMLHAPATRPTKDSSGGVDIAISIAIVISLTALYSRTHN